MDYRSKPQNDNLLELNIDEKNVSINYLTALGVIAVIITLAFATIKLIIPSKSEEQTALNVLVDQQILVQKIFNNVNMLLKSSLEGEFEASRSELKASFETLQSMHQSLLYGNDALKLDKLTHEAVKKIYFHPENSLDRLMTDYLLNAKLLALLSPQEASKPNAYTQRIQQLANGPLSTRLQAVQNVYREELKDQAGLQRWTLIALWSMVLAALVIAGLFILHPANKRIRTYVDSLKKSRFQMLTIKKQVEAEKNFLENSLLRSQALLDAASQAMLIYNVEDREIKLNKAFCDMLQIPDLISYKPTIESIQKVMRQRIRNHADLPSSFFEFSTPERESRSFQLALENGKFAECHIRPIHVGDTMLGKAWLLIDTTRHFLLAKKFSDQARHFQNVLDSIGDGVVVTDQSGKLSHFNPAAASLLGVNAGKMGGDNWYDQFEWLDVKSQTPVDITDLPFMHGSADEAIDPKELMLSFGEQENSRRMNVTGRPVKDTEGQVTGGVVVIRQNQQPESSERDSAFEQFLENVNEGVFFIDENLIIQPRYSRSLERLLGKDALANGSVIDMFQSIVPNNLLNVIDDYLKLIFHSVVTDKYVEELNPVREIEIQVNDPAKGWIKRHLSFGFKRMFQSETIQSVMVIARDVSDQVASAHKLKKTQSKIQKQIDLLFRVIHVDPSLLEKFVDDCATEIASIHFLLQREDLRSNPGPTLGKISRALISVKESAAFLDLRIFEDKAARFEKAVLLLHDKPRLSVGELQKLEKDLRDLHEVLDEVKRIVDHLINKLKVRFRGKRDEECRRLAGSIQSYVQRICREQGKRVHLDTSHFNALDIPYKERQAVPDMIVEVLRHIIENSIEAPQARQSIGKSPHALIEMVTVKTSENAYELSIRDDGKGMALLTPELSEVAQPQSKDSKTTENMNLHSTGLVLDSNFVKTIKSSNNRCLSDDLLAVENRIVSLGGKINTFSQHGNCNEVYISIPKKDHQK